MEVWSLHYQATRKCWQLRSCVRLQTGQPSMLCAPDHGRTTYLSDDTSRMRADWQVGLTSVCTSCQGGGYSVTAGPPSGCCCAATKCCLAHAANCPKHWPGWTNLHPSQPLWHQNIRCGLQMDLMHEVMQDLAQKHNEARTSAELEAAKPRPSKRPS